MLNVDFNVEIICIGQTDRQTDRQSDRHIKGLSVIHIQYFNKISNNTLSQLSNQTG